VELAVDDKAHAEARSHNEEAHIADEALARNVEGPDEGHAPGDDGGDEAGGADELAHSQTRGVCAEGGKSREDIWTAVSKSQQGDACQTLAHAQHARDGVQVDAEEVAGGDADGAEEQAEPEGHEGEGDGFEVCHAAVVERQVGDDAGLFIGAVGEDEGALVVGMVN
jgi:hypothetical protein